MAKQFQNINIPMRVLLIQPPYPYSEFPKPSSALIFLGTVLQQAGVEVEVLDLLSCRFSLAKVEDRLARFQPQIVGLTSVTMNFPAAVRILRHCKLCAPEITAVMGGPHVTFTAAQTLRDFPEVDVVVRGEGEETFGALVAAGGKNGLAGIAGLTCRCNGSLLENPDRPFLANLDLLPLPDRRLFPLARYLAMRVPASVLSSRGCPTGCSFCVGYRMTGRRGRFRSPPRVVDEIEAAQALGFAEVCIDDDLFTRNRRHVLEICGEILRRGLQLKLYIFARVDTVDEALLKSLKAAGCAMICFGLESGNQRILDLAGKRATVEKACRAVAMSKEAGIAPLGSFILGLPGETRETMEETIAFAQSLGIPHGFHLLSPFPGTKVRDRAEELGIRILTDDWSLYDADHAVTETKDLSAAEVEGFARGFFGRLGEEIENLKKATLAGTYHGPYREEMEKRLEVDFAWKLLAGDLIEEQGVIPREACHPKEEALGNLAARLAQATAMPLDFVKSKLDKLAGSGFLILQRHEDGGRWHWKEQ